ncbi:cytosine permease [Amycolatopsis sp. YIM 10]|uniref:purine-cytosine permease family protein n=1 Tax=Amycolatopsis sp. YIM 10 TaxID=2653857 RepID=UPI00129011A0|nr:cytosine permease [Amycolatopsis sp. YIM 10]QFU85998.1 Permease for cytosine/purines, uracil, thiamine, allantoin [Amycolatopsis sp. YIM 10]
MTETIPTRKNSPPQREYAKLAANENREDYSLRFAAHSFRRWRPLVVATTALGGIAYLADFAIGASIVFSYGFTSGVLAILAAALVIFVTGAPIAAACAKYGVDMDLLTRGAGFGYFGSTLTSLVYASFTVIFFALEGSIMAQAFDLALGVPLPIGYLLSTLIVLPFALYGMGALAKMQTWTQPLWIAGLILPFVVVAVREPGRLAEFASFGGTEGAGSQFSAIGFGFGMGVALSLIGQIGEQADYLRFMPEKTAANKRSWWAAVLAAGPGWVILGAAKQIGGALLAFLALGVVGEAHALEPIAPYLEAVKPALGPVALTFAALFVVVSQIKINTTNAYSGSLSFANFFSRVLHRHPGRVWYVLVNCGIALALMEFGAFALLNKILGFYSNVAIAWIGAVCADLLIVKPLGLSPRYVEFKRAYLHKINPVGFGSMVFASAVSITAYFGAFGQYPAAFSPLLALVIAVVCVPLLAWLTRGRYYLARPNTVATGDLRATHTCTVCGDAYELPDIADCSRQQGAICSLCCTLDSTCHDQCQQPGASPVDLPMPTARPPA